MIRTLQAIERCIPLEAREEWAAMLRGIPHDFAHTWEHCHAMHLTTGYHTYLYCFESDEARVVCPIAERRYGDSVDAVTPYGFSGFVGTGDCSTLPDHWKAFASRKGYVCGYIQLNPLWDNPTYYDPVDAQHYNNVFVVDLRDPLEQIVGRFEKRRRKQVRDAAATEMVFDKSRLKAFLLAEYAGFFARHQASTACRFSQATMERLCDGDDVVLVGCANRGEIEAAAMLACTPYAAEAIFQVSIPGGEHHAVALVWQRIQFARSRSIPLLNLGGGVRDNDSLAQFKERFGTVRRPLRCLKQVYDRDTYQRLCLEAGADPNGSGYFPPYRQPLNGHLAEA